MGYTKESTKDSILRAFLGCVLCCALLFESAGLSDKPDLAGSSTGSEIDWFNFSPFHDET